MALKNFRQRCGGRKQKKHHKFEKNLQPWQANKTIQPKIQPPIIYDTILSVFAHKIQQ